MSNFMERLALVIHTIAFLITLLFAYVFINDNVSGGTGMTGLLINIALALIPNTIGWVIKYLITGDTYFFPFGGD